MLEEKTKELGYKVGVRPPARPPRERARDSSVSAGAPAPWPPGRPSLGLSAPSAEGTGSFRPRGAWWEQPRSCSCWGTAQP